jgi:hypothetical protein
MNQTDSDLQFSSVVELPHSNVSTLEDMRRLAVVILDIEQEALLAGRILDLAQVRALPVVLLGIARDAAQEGELRRKLITIAAFLKDGWLPDTVRTNGGNKPFQVEIQVVQEKDWIRSVQSFLRHDDMLACYGEQTMGNRQRPLSDILGSSLNMPVYTFTGLEDVRQTRRFSFSQIVPWFSSLASIGAFLLLQARIVTSIQGSLQTIFLLLTMFAEVGLLVFVNSLFTVS